MKERGDQISECTGNALPEKMHPTEWLQREFLPAAELLQEKMALIDPILLA